MGWIAGKTGRADFTHVFKFKNKNSYANHMTLLAPSASALRKIVAVSDLTHDLVYNVRSQKSWCLRQEINVLQSYERLH